MKRLLVGFLLGLITATAGGVLAYSHRPIDRDLDRQMEQFQLDQRLRGIEEDLYRQRQDRAWDELRRDPC